MHRLDEVIVDLDTDRLAQYGAGPDDTQCLRYDYLRRLTDAWTPSSGSCPRALSLQRGRVTYTRASSV